MTHWWMSPIAASAILLTPFAVFVKHHDYTLTSPEVAICAGALAALGILLGLVMAFGGAVVRSVAFAGLIVVVIDIQTDGLGGALALLALGALAIAAWHLRRSLPAVAALTFSVMLVVTLVLPGSPALREQRIEPEAMSDPQDLPLLVHLVLDEYIGIEGVPWRFDAFGGYVSHMRDFWVGRDFQVYGRAYSRYKKTTSSLRHLLNFDSRRPSLADGLALGESAYFKEMSKRGYRIRVYQNDRMHFCKNTPSVTIVYCMTYPAQAVKNIEDLPLGTTSRAMLMLDVYVRLSPVLGMAPDAYREFRRAASRVGIALPVWQRTEVGLSPIISFGILDRLKEDVAAAAPGSMFFAHILAPHYPYVYDRDCSIRTPPWLTNRAETGRTPESRAIRYAQYLEQVVCLNHKLDEFFTAMDAAGVLDDAIIVVHGDHGSRITLPAKNPPPSVLVDDHSTLFALRQPAVPGGYDRRMLPLQKLLVPFVRTGMIPTGTAITGKPWVWRKGKKRPMPVFKRKLRPPPAASPRVRPSGSDG